MTMTNLATLGQILSSLAVLITLIYLAIEVKQNTQAMHAQTRHSVLEVSQAEINKFIDHPELVYGFTNSEKLSPLEYVKFHSWLAAMVRAREFSWLQYQNGVIDEDQWNTEQGVLGICLTQKRSHAWWQEIGRKSFNQKFVAFVDSYLEGKSDPGIIDKALNWETS